MSRGGAETGRERERIPNRRCTVSTEPGVGPKVMNCEIMTRTEVERLTDCATQVPLFYYFFRERAGEAQRERKENLKQVPCSVSSPCVGLSLTTVRS